MHVDVWIECALLELEKANFQKGSTIVRALSHLEQSASGHTSLDLLGNALAEKFQLNYLPSLLVKSGVTAKLTTLKRQERAEALADRYSFVGSSVKAVLLIDDILTTGTTMCTIADSILKISETCTIMIFTLAFTNNDSLLNRSLEKSILYRPEMQTLSVASEIQEDYTGSADLRKKILNDAFN
ncbi:MAG: hypothetical protein KF803_02550 [Cyclobacteriaceae bacterium]|nr:hypothetical protein [Cyclobacteriaceae bacterium]